MQNTSWVCTKSDDKLNFTEEGWNKFKTITLAKSAWMRRLIIIINISFSRAIQTAGLINCYGLRLACVQASRCRSIIMRKSNNQFLADRTNAPRLCYSDSVASVCRLWRYVLWLNGASYNYRPNAAKFTVDSLSHVWQIDWYTKWMTLTFV